MNQQRFPTIRRIGRWCVRVAPRIGFGLLVLFVLMAIPWTYFNIKWGRELEAKLAELKAQGMPLTFGEAAPKPVPDVQNAALLYQKVFRVQFPPAKPLVLEGSMGGLSGEEHDLIEDYIKTGHAARRQVREILNRPEVERDLQIIRQASQRPYSVFPINWDDGAGALFPHFSRFRAAAYILAAQAVISADAGRIEEALDWCQVALRMSEHAASEPIVIGQLVAIAMQAITLDAVQQIVSAADIHPALAHEFEQYLHQIDLYETFTAAMIAERGGCRELFDQLPKQHYKFFYDFGIRPCPLPLRLYASSLGSPVQKLDQLMYLKYMGRRIKLLKLPYREAGDQIYELDRGSSKCSYCVVTGLVSPVFVRFDAERDKAVARIGLCRVMLALKAYKYQRGVYPDSLTQLEQTLDWELPEDPFSGEDFVYQRQAEGFKLYSIGLDLEDDGGIAPKEPPQNLDRDEADIVWRCSK